MPNCPSWGAFSSGAAVMERYLGSMINLQGALLNIQYLLTSSWILLICTAFFIITYYSVNICIEVKSNRKSLDYKSSWSFKDEDKKRVGLTSLGNKSSDYKYSWSSKEDDDKKRVGLTNLGNTCFMNAVLQCLCHTQPLVDYCVRGSYLKDINYSSPTRGSLIKAFAEFVKNAVESKSTVSPYQLRSEVQRYAPSFSGSSQQDAQEFLRYLMQGLHDDINRVKYRSSTRDGDSWKRYQDSDDSIIVDLFAGKLKSSLQCTTCNNVSITHDPFWDISLPIPEGSRDVSLRQCLNLFSYPEILDGQNKAFCQMCKEKKRSSKKIEIDKFPKILVIHLKRFSVSSYSRKINAMIDCPLVFRNISEFSSRNCYSNSSSYALYGVVDHIGTSSSGHYVAKCKDPHTKEWNEFNDSRVTKTTDVITSNSYLLFYIQE